MIIKVSLPCWVPTVVCEYQVEGHPCGEEAAPSQQPLVLLFSQYGSDTGESRW